MAAFDGLLMLGCDEVTKEGYFDRTKLQGSLTKFVARDELLERLQQIEDYPALSIKPDLNKERIILRDVIDGQRKAIRSRAVYERSLSFGSVLPLQARSTQILCGWLGFGEVKVKVCGMTGSLQM